jgi:hypothetical protein
MKKNKYNMILLFLGILIVLLFVLFCLNKEGMTNDCMYQYLSPNQTNAPLDDATINDFMTKYDKHMDDIGSKIKIDRKTFDSWISSKVWCSEEIQFYIKNNYFPLNSYILYELKNNTKIKLPAPFTRSTIAFGYNSRLIYYQLIVPSYAGNPNLPPNTKKAQEIYSGSEPEPSCDSDPPAIDGPAASPAAGPTASLTSSPTGPTDSSPSPSPVMSSTIASNAADSNDACTSSCNDFCRNMN